MNAAFRHLSVRLWLTAVTGVMAAIMILPWWQQLLGIDWLVIPVAIMMGICFAVAGWVMNRIGMGFLTHHVNEAAAWERAGMMRESETAFGKAMATFDSFWLSPLLRRGKFQWFSGLMARFYLGRPAADTFGRSLIASHLRQFPQDASAAELWLEQLLAYEQHQSREHEAVVHISRRLGKHQRIQRLLMQFYMVNGRADFDAIQTYRRVWARQSPLPDESVRDLARLLLSAHTLNHWALEVYLKAYESGDEKALEGIAAAVERLPATEESRALIKAAEGILEGAGRVPSPMPLQEFQSENASLTFHDEPPPEYAFQSKTGRVSAGFQAILGHSGEKVTAIFQKCVTVRSLKRVLPVVAILTIIVLVVVTGNRFYNRPESPAPPSPDKTAEEVVITDPFTIQVAAYLKAADAQRFVDQLKQKELDAFWTQAASAKRSWYQVKVSHFPDREAAQAYGRELKSKGLIDDFYVANYDHERRNAVKP